MAATSQTFHPDWRDWIAKKLRHRIKRDKKREPGRPYLMRSLDKFERLVPHLRQRHEVVFQLEDVCDLVNAEEDVERWTPNVASRFLHYLTDIGVLNIRYAGRSGNAFRLLKNLAIAPDPSRQSGTARIAPLDPREAEKVLRPTSDHIDPEVEFDPMPAPSPANPVVVPDETVELDGTAVLAAIDTITANLGAINLNFRTELTGSAAGVAYDAQATISKAMTDLQRLRQAVLRGDGTPLQEIMDGD